MSNSINTRSRNYRMQLLSTVSAAVLLASGAQAAGSDEDRPQIWINLGWQFERDGGGQEAYDPSFFNAIVAGGFTSPLKVENALPWSYGAEGAITYQPKDSDWVISAAIRYGRAHGRKSIHEQTAGGPVKIHIGTFFHNTVTPAAVNFSQTKASNSETHTILDFQAGKDLGLGLFGSGSKSNVSVGVRYAQIKFGAHTNVTARPDKYYPTNQKYSDRQHLYNGLNSETRSFAGLGPTVSWKASVPLAGNEESTTLALDWGLNAGLLFGKQKAKGVHQTKTDYYVSGLFGPNKYNHYLHYHSQRTVPHTRSRSVTVPNLGGFAGLSLNWTNAKISLGYRADVFFKAMDGGIDKRKSENRGFFGPYASISIGIGD